MSKNLQETKPISAREKIVVVLVLFLIKILKPWEYDHQYDKYFASIVELMEKGKLTDKVEQNISV